MMSYTLCTSARPHDLGKQTYGSNGQPLSTGSHFPYYLQSCADEVMTRLQQLCGNHNNSIRDIAIICNV